MKKFLVLLSVLVIFAGCTDTKLLKKEFEPVKTFTLYMTAVINSSETKAKLTCNGYDDITVIFTSPEQIRGFKLHTEEDGYSAEIHDVSDAIPMVMVETDAPIRLLTDSVKKAIFLNGETVRKRNGDGYSTKMEVNGTTVTAEFDTDGYITAITTHDSAFSAVFSRNEQ